MVGTQQLGSLVHGSHDMGGMVRHSLTFGKLWKGDLLT